MRALSIIGIIMSLVGIVTSLIVMTEARCHCYGSDYYSDFHVPDEAVGGSLIMLLICIFFLVFSIVAAAVSFRKNNLATVPFQPQPQQAPFTTYPPQFGQPYNPGYGQQTNYPPQNPYPPNPYQNPTNPPGTNPWAPPTNPPQQ